MSLMLSTDPVPPPPLPNGPLTRFVADPAIFLHALERSLHHVALLGLHAAPWVAVAVAGLATASFAARWLLRRTGGVSGSYVELLTPGEVVPAGAAVFWRRAHAVISHRRLLGAGRRVVFEMAGSPPGVRIGLWAPPGVSPTALTKAAAAAWPGVVAVAGPPPSPLGPGRWAGGVLRLGAPEWFGFSPETNPEPLRGVIAELADCAKGESAVVQIVAEVAAGRRLRRARRAAMAVRSGRPTSGLARLLDGWKTKPATPSVGADPMRSADVRAITAKLADSPGCQVAVRYGVAGPCGSRPERRRLRARSAAIGASFGVYAGRNWLAPVRLRRPAAVLAERRAGRGQLMGASELAALAHLPVERLAGLSEAGAAAVAPPAAAYFGDGLDDEL